ncbi:acyl-CoA dehydrogenase family protein [Kitasatospora sp. McL0602]|uniref:acyl-CoA dehydrogenase family protein n=1 Tax=Kitasatospora sp. McL0602 TaxID=3439530 RepID=UPI003F8941CD
MVTQQPFASAPSLRAAELERLLGAPADRANPLGDSAVLGADEKYELPAGGEELLTAFGVTAEFVPTALGGRLAGVDGLVRVLRPVFRRDFALGYGTAAGSFAAALPVWLQGSESQRLAVAETLLRGGRLAVAEPDFEPDFDLELDEEDGRAAEFTAIPEADGGLLLDGTRRGVHGIGRADTVVAYARTGDGLTSTGLTAQLLGPGLLADRAARRLPRVLSEGARGGETGGLHLDQLRVPADAALGDGTRALLGALQITRSALPAMALGTAEAALRTALAFTVDSPARNGRPLGDNRRRDAVAGAFADLLAADCVLTVANRALHLLPERTSLLAAAAKYIAPQLMLDALQDLSAVLGAESFCTWGPYGMFGKAQRDLRLVHPTYPGTPCCLATIVPQLPMLARRDSPAAPPQELFRLDGELPPLVFDRLALAADEDPVGGQLLRAEAELADGPLAPLAGALADELRALQKDCAALPEEESGTPAFALGERFALLQTAAACLGVWRQLPGGFVAEPHWVALALSRLLSRLEHPVRLADGEAVERVAAEALDRFHQGRAHDLHGQPLGA